MTTVELHKILDDKNKKLSVKELQQVIYELKQKSYTKNSSLTKEYNKGYTSKEFFTMYSNYYSGEQNAFQIALDLLEHLDSDKTEV